MGRLKIKSKVKRKKVRAAYDAEMNEMQEWQDNMYNPGHYVGTGKLPYPLKQLSKHPKLKAAYLAWILIPLAAALFFTDLVWYQLAPALLLVLAFIFIIWDSRRVLMKNKNKRS